MSKPGTAMAHLDSPQAAKNAIHHLHGHKLLGQTLELNYSRHSYIADYSQGGTLPDGNPCWKDFSQSRNNRFLTAEGTSKNRIISPGKILHFYNAPPDSTTESLNEVMWWSSFSVTRLCCQYTGCLWLYSVVCVCAHVVPVPLCTYRSSLKWGVSCQ